MLTPLPGARELLHRIGDLGLQVVLAALLEQERPGVGGVL
jgi:hypothetical protein